MEILKSLIIGWSLTWGATIIALASLKSGLSSVVAFKTRYTSESTLFFKSDELFLKTPLYVFGIWAAGCALILAVYWLVARFKNSNG